jgi:DNA-binding SARP family transcriptional activator/tetratricopeptide (TPR) repeat protein
MEETRRPRYQVLGPVELFGADGAVRLGGPKQRAVLALLLLNANQVVAEQRFLAMVWGDDAPPSVRGQLQMYISQLRKLIGDPVIVRRPPGYLIRVERGELDLDIFDERIRRAREDLVAGRDDDAMAGYSAALALWQEPVLGGVTGSLLAREGPVLGDRRLAALEEYFDLRLAGGRLEHLVRDVRAAAEEHPLRERLSAQLMLALHGSGRSAEALEVYTATRTRLVAEKGVEPGPLLRETQSRVLRHEDRPAPPASPMPRQLPGDVPVFAGRVEQLAHLDSLVPTGADPVVSSVVIAGGAGVGKTTLAVHWAHRVGHRFPDGLLYANLRGFDPSGNTVAPDEVVRGFLDALNLPAAGIPAGAQARFNLYRSVLADKRVLVVLDNVRDAEQVRSLLPGSPGCLTVVTSRDQLPSLIASEGAMPVVLGLMRESEARAMLVRRLDAARVEAEPDALTRIIDLCAQLPLALAIVAARAATNPGFPLAALADELQEARGDLSVFDAGDPASVRTVFSWSYRALSAPAARLFRLLGLHPGPHVTPVAAASLAGVAVSQARALLTELARAHLLVESRPGQFGFHDLLRAYARELTGDQDPEAARRQAIHRMLDHYLHTSAQAARIMRPQRMTLIPLPPVLDGVTVRDVRTEQQAAGWFAGEYTVLHAMIELAAVHRIDTHAWQLADALTSTLWHGGAGWLGERRIYETALSAARRLDDQLALGLSHGAFAVFHLMHNQPADAEAALMVALRLYEELGDVDLLADVHQGLSAVCARMGREAEMPGYIEKALDLFRAAGNEIGVANSYLHLAYAYARLGDPERAIILSKQAIELFARLRTVRNEAPAWEGLADANRRAGNHDEAVTGYRRAIELHRQAGSGFREVDSLLQIGDIQHERGEDDEARAAWRQALAIVEKLRLPGHADLFRERLARLAE